jgi:peptidoglycan hydrolase-like protein with peptidoglycan-binding domain
LRTFSSATRSKRSDRIGHGKDRTAARGRAKVAVQQILADLGYSPGAIDGAMGDATSAPSAPFNDRNGPDRNITPELLDELERVTGRDTSKLAER